jgi:hypothetical protein
MVSGPFFVVLEVFECPVNVGRLPPFVTTAEEQYANPAEHRVIDPVAGSPINSQFAQTVAQCLAVAKIPRPEPVDPLAIFACARASGSCDNQSSNTSFLHG